MNEEGLPFRADVGCWMSREANRKYQEQLPNSPITSVIHLGRVFRHSETSAVAQGRLGDRLEDHPGLCQKT